MCSDACCDVEDGPTVSVEAGIVGGGTEGEDSRTEVLSTSTTRTGYSPQGRASVKSSSTSSCGCKRNDSGIDRVRSRDKI